MRKPRLLIPLTIQFSVRYLLRTGLLRRLCEFVQPVIVMSWEDEELRAELEQAGANVALLPGTNFGPEYVRVRRQIDTWHFKRLKSPSVAIDRRRSRIHETAKLRRTRFLREVRNSLIIALPGSEKRLLGKERMLLKENTNIDAFDKLLSELEPDAVFSLTPFHKQEELVLRAAESRGLPMCTAILSFDNLTTRGWIPVTFDRYLLWNQYNEAELRRAYPEAAASYVKIVGPAQFDFYWDRQYLLDEGEWRKRAALPEGRPVILFGGAGKTIAPHESRFLLQLDEAINKGDILGKPVILFRRHPMDTLENWSPILERAKNVVCREPWAEGKIPKYTNIKPGDITNLASTLCHSDVHVNVSSTMTLDGAVFDRPQIGPAYDDGPGRRYDRICRELYLREHYLPITNSGGLHVVHSRDELIAAVNDALNNPGERAEGRKRLLGEICTFTDGKSTGRVAEEIYKFLTMR